MMQSSVGRAPHDPVSAPASIAGGDSVRDVDELHPVTTTATSKSIVPKIARDIVLQERDELGIALSQLYSYASLRRSENNADAGAQAKADRSNMLYTKYGSATAWVEPEILAMPSSQVRDFLEIESGLQTYAYYLETFRAPPPARSQ